MLDAKSIIPFWVNYKRPFLPSDSLILLRVFRALRVSITFFIAVRLGSFRPTRACLNFNDILSQAF